jgi:CheY-like chemotaxis protein
VSNNRARILIIEDDQQVASYIEDVLTVAGFAVAGIATTANEALVLAAEHLPQLALIDIQLPGAMDGIKLASLIRVKFNVPAIFLSGLADPDTIRRAEAAQPLGFLQKPFVPSQVFNAIEQALAAGS